MESGLRREEAWRTLGGEWDLLVVGGGITGAAVLRQAVRAGLRAALVEQRDFAWGASSRSTKLVHGGARYLAHLQLGMVREALRERDRLRAEGSGLVQDLPMVFVSPGGGSDRWQARAAMTVYHGMLGRGRPDELDEEGLRAALPGLRVERGARGIPYDEAQVDDARLVLRVIREAVRAGGCAVNHARVLELVRERGRVAGARVQDRLGTGGTVTVRARAVVNATGAWADGLRAQVEGAPRLRPLRGSHLLFPAWRFPLACGASFRHPRDRRYLSVLPWEDVTVVGTTDLDHSAPLDDGPAVAPVEVAYLLELLAAHFPSLALRASDAVSTIAGIRPVIASGTADPSREPRESWIGDEQGLVTVTGGKLTTSRALAHQALDALSARLPELAHLDPGARLLDEVPPVLEGAPEALLDASARARLLGRHGADAAALVACAGPGELEPVGGTCTRWVELRFAARHEAVGHLDDLLLRRVRIGLALPEGGAGQLDRVRRICAEELAWDGARWDAEVLAYRETWRTQHAVPTAAG